MVATPRPITRPTEQLTQATGRLLLVSNRGPLEHAIDDIGRITRSESGGGVAIALSTVARSEPLTWIAGTANFADRAIALTGERLPLSSASDLKLVNLPEEVYDAHYHTFCNPLLWFVQHSLGGELDRTRDVQRDAIDSWQRGYLPVNRLFASSVLEEIGRGEPGCRVMLQDYHLYLAPRFIRDARPQVTLQQFVHIPWPAPSQWAVLPDSIVREICSALLANDSIGFQTEDCVDNFFATCRAYLGRAAAVSEREGEVRSQGQTTSVWSNPIAVDVAELRELMASPAVQQYKRALAGAAGEKLIVRVDRLDPSKNVLRGFQAYETLLERSRELRGHVRFLAFLVPSRTGIPEYDGYARQVFDRVDAINAKYGTPGWTPISVFHEHNRLRALAGLSLYDVLLVNSLADGMNLVSKEGPAVNEKDGALVLSASTGSYRELQRAAIGIDPLDVAATAEAMRSALALQPAERAGRAASLRRAIEQHQLKDWLRHQLKDLAITEYIKSLARVPVSPALR